MSLDKDYDRQIADLRRKMEELETLKTMHVQKLEGIQKFQDLIAKLVSDYSLTENELFVARSEAIVAWIKSSAKENSEPPLYWTQLRDYFATVIEKQQKGGKRGKKEKDPINSPTLPTGVYRNPLTGERIEKKRRNPKQLDTWVDEFGFTEVRSWLKK